MPACLSAGLEHPHGEVLRPKNFNFWYFFGVLSLLVLVNQLLTGIWLTMSYNPSQEGAFASVEYIMRDVDFGWILRYMHSTGASAFLSWSTCTCSGPCCTAPTKKPRELIWIFGMLIFVALMAEAFVGYVLPWGQMSYWGAQVIISLFGAIPVVGEDLVTWIRGDFLISGVTLNRFSPCTWWPCPSFAGAGGVAPAGVARGGFQQPRRRGNQKPKGRMASRWTVLPFHPYYTVHDLQAARVFLFVFCGIIFFMPEMGGYFSRIRQFRGGQRPEDAGAYRPGVVFHPVLLGAAGGARQVLGLHRLCRPSVAIPSCCPGWIAARSTPGAIAAISPR